MIEQYSLEREYKGAIEPQSTGTPVSGLLVMADGTAVRGRGAGAHGTAVGELVFQTGMAGYQEALTDPSYRGQMLVFTYPLVGNYGVGPSMSQSARMHVSAAIVSDLMTSGGHRDSSSSLDAMLRAGGIPALTGVDTRSLVRHVRSHGVVPAALAVGPEAGLPSEAELCLLAQCLNYDAIDFVRECSTPSLVWHPAAREDGPRLALIDYGAKSALLDYLVGKGAGVWLVPADMETGEVLALQPDGILLSNGPGDPTCLDYAIKTTRELVEDAGVPVFGVCLGHQLLALAAGAATTKMRFGHRGINQPVLDIDSGRVAITTQNHGYMVDAGSVPPEYRITHTNLNDGTVEGIAHRSKPVWGVQWHPEACPGPRDTQAAIDHFLVACGVPRA